MANDSAHAHPGPIRYLSIAWLITLAAMVAFLWCAYDSYQRFTETAQRNLRIQELRGQIMRLDEVLTMSARMCALTGDLSWESRYKKFEPQLDAAIHEAMTYSLGAQTTRQTDAANAALIQFENKAFELVHEGKLDEARAQLFSDAYAAQKAIYSQGMDQLGNQLAEASKRAMESERNRIAFQLAGGAVVIALLLVGWGVVVRIVNQGMRTRQQLDKIERDLDIARHIQRGLLPKQRPDTPGFEIEGWSKPADQTGGDYFDWMRLPEGDTLITLADVTGHGIGPALIVAVCRAYMRAAAGGNGTALEEAVAQVNNLLTLDMPEGRFVTAAVGLLRPATSEMSLISAGQAPLFFYRAATGTVETWDADELPLGIAAGMDFPAARRIQFDPGDTLVLATDGFFEWDNVAGEQYGIRRLESFVRAHAQRSPASFIDALHAEVVAHASGRVQPDDLTIVVIKRSGQPAAVVDNSAAYALSTEGVA